nr:GXWXG domain-containing protein [Rhizobium sp. 16-449-1b]
MGDNQDRKQISTVVWFQTLPSVLITDIVGPWRGEGIPSGHPLDGLLENLNWFGKHFHANLTADALLFQRQPSRLAPYSRHFSLSGMSCISPSSVVHPSQEGPFLIEGVFERARAA